MQNNRHKNKHHFTAAISPRECLAIHEDYLVNFAKARVNDTELVRDLVQETFLAALENMDTFQHNSSERTWLTAILKHKIYKSYFNKSRNIILLIGNYNYRQKINHGNEVQSLNLTNFTASDEWLHSKEFCMVLRNCLKQLPELSQKVFLNRYLTEQPKETTCRALRISEVYYFVICHRIKLHFKKYFQQYWY